jgi:thiamine biosynthesis lipoprotein
VLFRSAPTGILADGLSTALLVMGAQAGLRLCARLDGVDALLIAKDGRRWQTPGLQLG